MCRKIAMVMVATFGLRASVQTQGMLALFVISVALGAHLKYQPFDEPVLDRLEVYGLGAAFTTLYFGMFFFTDDVVFAPWWGFMVTFVIMAANVLFISMFFLYIFRALGTRGSFSHLTPIGVKRREEIKRVLECPNALQTFFIFLVEMVST